MEEANHEMQRLLGETASPPAADLVLDGRPLDAAWVISVLEPYLTEARRVRTEEVLDGRTYTVATVVEGLINTGNVSAVMRSAEALGFQPFHVITGQEQRYKTSQRTSQGAEKWLDVFPWEAPADCVAHLKAHGYTVVATHLDATSVPIGEIDFTQKTALVFGNERDGISQEMAALADRRCLIPMPGFTQSFNISVAAAVALYHARQDRLFRQGFQGDLSDAARLDVRARFYRRGIRHAENLLRRALAETG
ncbi:MAG: TrmH family RNA methyltransferase [Rhodothermales bacterium]